MKQAIGVKRAARLLAVSVVTGWSVLAGANARAGDIPICSAQTAAITGVDEGVNAAGDAAGDILGALGLPVSDEGIQEQLNQVNANIAALAGPLYTIAASTCSTDNTLSTPPGLSALASSWSDGTDSEPDVLVIPTQLEGTTGVASSPLAKEVDVANTAALTAAQLESVLTDPAGVLLKNRMDGYENMQGIALTNIAADKAALLKEDVQKNLLKTSANVKDLLANEGAIQIAMVDVLNRLDESVNQMAANAAQKGLNDANEEKVLRNGRSTMADVLVAAAGLSIAGIAAGATAATGGQ